MPVIINEVEIFHPPPAAPGAVPSPSAPSAAPLKDKVVAEPAPEQFRRLLRDQRERRRRLEAN